jgi:hypothetical protein
MSIIQIDYANLLSELKQDTVKIRFNAKVFLVNNLATYYKLVNYLEGMADRTLHISDEEFCSGDDTIPDLKKVISTLNNHNDENVLITSVGEYLRFGFAVEKNGRHLFSIISRQAHSDKRVWIPIYAAKDEFLNAVNELDDEHYPNVIYEINGTPSGFETIVYAKKFAKTPGLATASGLREWLYFWDNEKVKSGMTVATRHVTQVKESDGLYTVRVITEPFQYFESRISSETKIDKSLGNDEKWLHLASYATVPGCPIQDAIQRALNLLLFDPHQVLSTWKTADNNTKWLFWLWYRLGLNSQSDYISHAVSSADSFLQISQTLETDILQCIDNPNFDDWIEQRNVVMAELGVTSFSQAYWSVFDSITDNRKKLKMLSGNTHEERTKIIEVVSSALKDGKTIHDFKMILQEKFPDLYVYLAKADYGDDELQAYLCQYKTLKIKDEFALTISDSAEQINFYDYDSRGKLLNDIKTSAPAYYLWVDGMGVEWIDLLLSKIAAADSSLPTPEVMIGTAVLPTVTSVNMESADPDTVNKKLNDLDSLGHIKDKSDCNYFSIVAKQLELISSIALDIVRIINTHSGMDVVITADHGMSRMAAKGFHSMEGVKPQKSAEVYSLGRYCQFSDDASMPAVSHTIKSDNIIAFKTHAHFTCSGYAPGEIHGGATPEEILVPVIRFRKTKSSSKAADSECSYSMDDSVTRQASGICAFAIKTKGVVTKVTVEVLSNRYPAKKISDGSWVANIPGLSANNYYQAKVYLNNIYTDKTEKIYVKVPGIAFDDDF